MFDGIGVFGLFLVIFDVLLFGGSGFCFEIWVNGVVV